MGKRSHLGKVFQITNMDNFIVSLQRECVTDTVQMVGATFFGDKNKLLYILDDEEVLNSFLSLDVIEQESQKYIFSTALYTDKFFIKPQHIENIIADISIDLSDTIMLRLVDHGILEMCWQNDDVAWRIKR